MSKSKAAPAPETIKVRATKRGYYDLKLREEGDVFLLQEVEVTVLEDLTTQRKKMGPDGKPETKTLSALQQFSGSWMVVVSDDEPEQVTGAQQAVNRAVLAQIEGRS